MFYLRITPENNKLLVTNVVEIGFVDVKYCIETNLNGFGLLKQDRPVLNTVYTDSDRKSFV